MAYVWYPMIENIEVYCVSLELQYLNLILKLKLDETQGSNRQSVGRTGNPNP